MKSDFQKFNLGLVKFVMPIRGTSREIYCVDTHFCNQGQRPRLGKEHTGRCKGQGAKGGHQVSKYRQRGDPKAKSQVIS